MLLLRLFFSLSHGYNADRGHRTGSNNFFGSGRLLQSGRKHMKTQDHTPEYFIPGIYNKSSKSYTSVLLLCVT